MNRLPLWVLAAISLPSVCRARLAEPTLPALNELKGSLIVGHIGLAEAGSGCTATIGGCFRLYSGSAPTPIAVDHSPSKWACWGVVGGRIDSNIKFQLIYL